MQPFHGNIEQLTADNTFFRKELFTAPHSQLVVMSLLPSEEIGTEVHDKEDQFIRVEQGKGKAIIDGQEYPLSDGVAVVVPAGTEHNIINTSVSDPLKLYTIYSPAHHPEGTIHETKADAMRAEEEEHGSA